MMQRRIHQIKTTAGEMQVVDHGDLDATPILFVHGFPLDHRMWHQQIEHLGRPGKFRLLCPDLIGCGNSAPVTNPTSMRQVADQLADMLNQLAVGPVVFCGLSMGGYIGWQFCQHHRAQISHLIAANTRAAADDEITRRGRHVMAKTITTIGTKTLADMMVKKLFSPKQSVGPSSDHVNKIHAMIAATPVETITQYQLAMAARQDMDDFLQSIDLPTLIIAGREDVITPADEMKTMAGHIPNSQFQCIEQSGHLTPLEQASKFNTAVECFLEQHLTTSPLRSR